MPLTEDQRKTRIAGLVGDSENAALAGGIDLLWSYYADLEALSPTLRDLYTQRDAIDYVLGVGGERALTDWRTPNIESRQGKRPDTLRAMRAAVQQEIERLESIAATSGAPAVGQITATVPRTAQDALGENPPAVPDGASPRYRGDLYSRTAQPW